MNSHLEILCQNIGIFYTRRRNIIN